MTRSFSMRLLFLAAISMVCVLALAPVGFAGEDDPGPTQAGEVLGVQTTTSTNRTSSSSTSHSTTSASSKSKTATAKKDTVRAKGGVQTGIGGMAAAAQPSMLLALTLAGGGLVFLTAAAGIAPARRRTDR